MSTVGTVQPGSGQASFASAATQILGKDDFLKLFVTQMQHQDPMNPTGDKEFMGQMAQFSSLEQLTNVAKALDEMNFASQTAHAVALLGKTLTWERKDGTLGSGVAGSVSFTDGAIVVDVGDEEIEPAAVRSVR